MDQTRRIALLLDRSLSFVRGVIRGVRVYAADKPNWVLRDVPPRLQIVSHVRDWKPHGIIAGLVLKRVAQELIRMRTPLIDTAYTLPGLKVPTVDVDHTAVGRLAAEYLLDRKFGHYGFFGSESAAYSRIRESAFRQRVAEAGHVVSSCHTEYLADLTTPALWKKSAQKTRRWLRQLAKPRSHSLLRGCPGPLSSGRMSSNRTEDTRRHRSDRLRQRRAGMYLVAARTVQHRGSVATHRL